MVDSMDRTPRHLPHFAVVICTRHRPVGIVDAVRSSLTSDPSPGLVIVVDQSDVSSPDPLDEFDGSPGFVHVRDDHRGLSRARNLGTAVAEAAGATIVAYTDDDCVVANGWLAGFESMLQAAPHFALAFGTTKAAPHDRLAGTIPAYTVRTTFVGRGLAVKARLEGMGACMAVRVVAWRQIGGFDDHMGAGTSLAAAEENDLSVRLLHHGFAVAETPDAEAVHRGYRDRDAVTAMVAGYMRGSGAVTAKMVRLGGFRALWSLGMIGRRWLARSTGIDIEHSPPRWVRLRHFVAGAIIGCTTRIDRTTGRFLPSRGIDDLVAREAIGQRGASSR